MLVLSAFQDDRIHIVMPDGRTIVVTVTRLTDKVRLGFEAPRDVKIWRDDVLQRMEDKQ